MKQQNDIIADHHAEQAVIWRGMWEAQLAEIESAIRSGRTADALGAALVAVRAFPEGRGKCGGDCAAARSRRECGRAESVLEQLFNRALVVIRSEAAARQLDVAAVDAGAIALREAYAPHPHGDGTASGAGCPATGLWPDCMTGAEWEKLPETRRRDLLAFRDLLGRVNAAPQPEPTPEHATPLPGWKRGKLVLKKCPNGPREPGIFTFGSKVYTVPSGKAWQAVCALIRADAFDGHGVEMPSPSQWFKGGSRPFFTERMTKGAAGWNIKTQ